MSFIQGPKCVKYLTEIKDGSPLLQVPFTFEDMFHIKCKAFRAVKQPLQVRAAEEKKGSEENHGITEL